MRHILTLVALSVSTAAFAQAGPVGAPGRYVVVHSPHVQRDTILLDTATGRTWQLQSDPTRDAFFWVPLARADNTPEMQAWLKANPRTDQPKEGEAKESDQPSQ